MYTLELFEGSRWSFLVYKNNRIIFRSQASELKPVINFIRQYNTKQQSAVIFDRIIGRGAALLLSLVHLTEIRMLILSEGGKQVLKKKNINFIAKKEVKFIRKYGSEKLCQPQMYTPLASRRRAKAAMATARNRACLFSFA